METKAETSYWDFRRDDFTYTSKLLLMDTPTTILITWVLYIIFVLKLGPRIMENRPPYHFSNLLIVYNIVQVVSSAYMVYMGGSILWKYGLKPKCLDNTDDKIGYLTTIHIYYLLKVVELLDTVFFVFRKKFNQASFLHVYHHSYMVLSTWFIVRYDPSYAILFPGALNSCVHVVMYTGCHTGVTGLSAFPALAKYLWWKKYITSLQLVQFVVIIYHMLRCYYTSNCPPTYLMSFSKIANCMLFIILFSDFYIKAYKKPILKDQIASRKNIENSETTTNVTTDTKTVDSIENTDGQENSRIVMRANGNCKVYNVVGHRKKII